MAAVSIHSESPPCMVLIIHSAEAPALTALRCGDWPGFAFCAAASKQELRATLESVTVQVGIICGALRDRRLRDLIAVLQEAAPEVALLWVVEDDAAITLPPATLTLPSLEPDAAFFRTLTLASQVTTSHRETRGVQAALQSLTSFTDEFATLQPRERIAERLLEMALALLQTPRRPVTGAVLMVVDSPYLTVHAAQPPYDAFLGASLPHPLCGEINQLVERQRMLATTERILIPLCWFGRVSGVLLLEGTSLPVVLPDSLHLLVNQAAAAMESAILFELAAIDTTTRAYTRTFTVHRLYEALKSTYRTGLDLSVMMMDLDKFKLVNDTYGHLVGDRVLHAAGQLLRSTLRESDVLGRYGGDEFLLILPNTPIAGAIEVTRRLLRSVKEFSMDINGTDLTLQISVGIGGISQDDQIAPNTVRPDHAFFQRAMERLIAQADGYMYRAKHTTTTRYAAGLPMSWGSLMVSEGLLMV
jgi:diguanylate cyclase (GGDEF)-like protein